MVNPLLNLGFVSVHWYSIFISLAILIPYLFIRKKAPQFKIKKDDIDNLLLIVVPLGIIGARVYHVVDKWQYYQVHLVEIFYIWQGGLGIFGGLLVGLLVTWWYCRANKINLLNLLDLTLPYLLLGQAIGRVGNYFNSEAYGQATNLPWGIMINGSRVHPTFFYEALWDLIGFVVLIKIGSRLKKGQAVALYLIIYGSGRFIAEIFRVDTFQINGFKIGLLVSILSACIGLFLLTRFTTMVSTGKKTAVPDKY